MEEISTKDNIIKTAVSLFAKNGFNGTSIRDICKDVGIKESSFYNYFSKKDDLLDVIFNEFYLIFNNDTIPIDKIENAVLKFLPGTILYQSLKNYFFKIHDEYKRNLWQILLNEQFKSEKAAQLIKDVNQSFWNISVALFTVMQDKGIILKEKDVKKISFIFSNAVRNLFYDYLISYDLNTEEIPNLKLLSDFFIEYIE